MKHLDKIIAIVMLVFAVAFNLWIYRLEPTAKIDPNDNLFQFALVYRTNQIWDFADNKCSGIFKQFCVSSYLIDHWVPNWNEGYNLPFYYAHMPQIVIVSWFRSIGHFFTDLFSFYHLIIYLLLSLFPISVFLALRIVNLPWLTAGFGALLSSHISTDGLYGLDPPSFLWRGYGLSSQLFAMVFLPLAIAFAWKYFQKHSTRTDLVLAILFLVLTTSGHLGIGIMTFISLLPLAIFPITDWKMHLKKLVILAGVAVFLLSYWIIPAFLGDKFHNFSFWDPVWKFNSYGANETVARLFNGDLFDYGRLPVFTLLVLVGAFVSPPFAFLFLFWFLAYFGRTTWGGLIDLVPAMKEFHLSRFIVGVHLAGLFLAPIGLSWLVSRVTYKVARLSVIFLAVFGILVFMYPQTIRYNDLNNTLITRANDNYARQSPDMNALVETLQGLPAGRVFSGRGGGWGKDFTIAETTATLYLGNFALPTVLWMPETWSPNADTEQYFREDKMEDYELFNIRYVAAPTKQKPLSFWRLIKENPTWKLYEVETGGYFAAAVRSAVVSANKYNRVNAVRLWIQSDDPRNGLYPELSFDTDSYPRNFGLPNFKMLDEVTYQVPDGSVHNLFAEIPKYIGETATLKNVKISDERVEADMVFSANVTVPEGCTECMVILKQTYHPNWRVKVDGASIEPIIIFPFFIGIPIPAGTHDIVATYRPSGLKIILLTISVLTFISITILYIRRKRLNNNSLGI